MIILRTMALLILSNCFMTMAWYGHLRYKTAPLYAAILASWGFGLFRISASGARQSLGLRNPERVSTQNPAGMHHPDRLHSLRGTLPRRGNQPKIRNFFRLGARRGRGGLLQIAARLFPRRSAGPRPHPPWTLRRSRLSSRERRIFRRSRAFSFPSKARSRLR